MSTMNRGSTPVDKERSDSLNTMNLVKIVRAYVKQMVDEVPGYKALLLDKETMRICSTLFGRSELAEHNVVHVEKLALDAKEHMELKAVCFVRPTRENVTALKRELRQPRYQSYHLYFSNLVTQMHLQELAEVDAAKEQVQGVQEFYGDFIALDAAHFTVPVESNAVLINPRAASLSGNTEYELVDRLVQGLSGLFLAVRRRPVLRYQRGSDTARRLAESLYSLTYKQQVNVFDFGSRSAPLVLLLDRRDDPVTPLLTQWTYQAMVHELLGLRDNTVRLESAKVSEQFREVVLDTASDEFFAAQRFANYGDVGMSVKALVDRFAEKSAAHRQVNSLEDMRRFVMEHSDFSRQQSNTSKHVAVMTALSEQVARRHLMDLSMLEQELANPSATLSASSSWDALISALRAPSTSDADAARLACLYALRFEGEGPGRQRQLLDALAAGGVRERSPQLHAAVAAVTRYGGADRRSSDLYGGGGNIMAKASKLLKGLQLAGVDNVYTQHTPLLLATLREVANGGLSTTGYPFMAGTQDEAAASAAALKQRPPSEVIVFIIGGTTYEEAKAVAEWNAAPGCSMRVLLGGSDVLNSAAFLAALGAGSGVDGGGGDDVL